MLFRSWMGGNAGSSGRRPETSPSESVSVSRSGLPTAKTRWPTRAEAIKLMSRHPNLIRRPMLVQGSKIALGFDEDEFRELTGR